MKKFSPILIVVGVCLLLFLYVKVRPFDIAEDAPIDVEENPQTGTTSAESSPTVEPNPHDIPQADDPRLTRLPDGRVYYNPSVESSRTLDQSPTPDEALAVVDQLISHYRFAYKENPVGVENFEITEQLLGKNPKKIVFIAEDSSALDGNELIDQWGTPYFFHPQSSDYMEIVSAGPDKTLWTKDDIGHIAQEENL